MSEPPLEVVPPFMANPRTRIPAPVRNWMGSLLQGPPRGPRRRQRQACAFALGRIGDFVLVLPVLALLRREFGADQLTVVVPAGVVELATIELPGVELIVLPSEAPGLFRDIVPLWRHERRRFATDRFARRIVLNYFRPLYHEIALTWADAAVDLRLDPAAYPPAMADGQCRELQAHQRMASIVLGRAVSWDEIVPHFTHFPSGNDGRLLVYPLSHDGTRDLPAALVATLLQDWRRRSQAPVVFGGAPRHQDRLHQYVDACRAAGVDQLTVETPAGVTAFVSHLGAAGAILAADSAAAHVGGAFDKPTVVLPSPDWYGFSQPWRKSARQRCFPLGTPAGQIAPALPGL